MSHHVLREGGFILVAAGVFLLALWRLWPRPAGHRRAADPPWWWKPWLAPWLAWREWRDRPRPVSRPRGERGERLATDTDVRAALPLTPLPAPPRAYKRPAQVPRVVPDVPEQCWCGQGPRWHHPQYVTDALEARS